MAIEADRLFNIVVRGARRLQYKLFLAPRGQGAPVPRAVWEKQYREGVWDYLDSIGELAHYMIVLGYVRHFFREPSVLDIGCGHGRLLELMNAEPLRNYVGIDISREAIGKAESKPSTNARFEVADFEQWTPAEKFDVVVFNESLCYAKQPVKVLLRFANALEREGAIILSLCRYGNHDIIWQNIEKHFATLDATTVENSKRQVWDIKVLRPRPASTAD